MLERAAEMIDLTETASGVAFGIRVTTRSARAGIAGLHDGALRVKLSSPPVDGAANAELTALLAKHFKVAKSCVTIISGETSRNKRVQISGISSAAVKERLAGAGDLPSGKSA